MSTAEPVAGRGRVVLSGVTKRFGSSLAVDDLSIEIADEELFVLLGPSGCGKSTVLRMIAGLEDPTAGTVEIGGYRVDDVDPKDRDIAMVFQNYALYPHMTVRRNIEFPLRSRGIDRDQRSVLVTEAASALDLAGLLDRKPSQLSGGQRQRVALARAIVRRPHVFLMDEPLSNLDAKLRVQTRAQIVELQQRLATTTIYVTHDQVEAMTMGERIGVMDRGVLQQVGPPQVVYDRPANVFVAGFLGSPAMNFDTRAVSDESLIPALPAAGAAALRGAGIERVTLGVRPEDLTITPDGIWPATVAVVEELGHERHVACRLPDGPLWIARFESRAARPAVGEAVRLSPHGGRIHLFHPETGIRIDA